MVLNELELLEANDLWFQLLHTPAEPVDCSFALCQNVLRWATYEVVGDAGEAKIAALDWLLETWVPMSDVDPFTQESILFQLHKDIEIDTTTGTAYLRITFDQDAQLGSYFAANVIGVSVSSTIEYGSI